MVAVGRTWRWTRGGRRSPEVTRGGVWVPAWATRRCRARAGEGSASSVWRTRSTACCRGRGRPSPIPVPSSRLRAVAMRRTLHCVAVGGGICRGASTTARTVVSGRLGRRPGPSASCSTPVTRRARNRARHRGPGESQCRCAVLKASAVGRPVDPPGARPQAHWDALALRPRAQGRARVGRHPDRGGGSPAAEERCWWRYLSR